MTNEPWARRDGETEVAFEAFRVYRDMGKTRNIRSVAQVLGKSNQLISRWSSLHDWVTRSSAFDNHRDAEHLDATFDQEQQILNRMLDSVDLMRRRAHEVLATTEEISPALAVRMLEACAKIIATRHGLRTTDTEQAVTVDVVALATELMNRGRPNP